MSKTREKSILQFLIKHRERYVTSKELAEYLSCSDRTVRNHLKSIDQTLNLQGVSLVSKQGQGYRLFFESQEACQTFRMIYELGDDYNTKSSMSQSDDRLAFILNKLLFEQVPVLFDDLVEELYVSRSTLSNDFKKIRQMLAEYNLTIESRANKGVYVSGEELDKRRFIISYFLENQFFKALHSYVKSNFFDQNLPLEELAKIVLEECQEACRLACADDFIQDFPDKYNTYIEQGGTNVSGGQKQRLCIARALLKHPKILILDDSTSAVDTATEASIKEALASLKGTTKIIIAQRISSLQHANQIIILDNGKIHAIGNHEELLKNDEIYQEIYDSQLKGVDL